MSTARKAIEGPYIGVDLDGTLADDTIWLGELHIGTPVPLMVARVKAHLACGDEVKIFTARMATGDVEKKKAAIQEWCLKHIGQVLDVTCIKTYQMTAFYDDRAIQVRRNTGIRADGEI